MREECGAVALCSAIKKKLVGISARSSDEETQSDASGRPKTPPERFAGARGSHAKGDAKESADEGQPSALLPPHQRERTTGTHVAPVRGQRAGAPAGQAGGSTPQEQGQQGSGLGRSRPRRRRRPANVRLRRRERSPVQIAGLHRARAARRRAANATAAATIGARGQPRVARRRVVQAAGCVAGQRRRSTTAAAASALAGRLVRPAARGPQIPRERAKTRKYAAGLSDV